MQSSQVVYQLDEPGAGISFLELTWHRCVVKSIFLRSTTRENALVYLDQVLILFNRELVKVNSDQMTERVLVKRPFFIEDSSRDWSVAMLCRHLSKINFGIAKMIEIKRTAFNKDLPHARERLKAVKPELERNQLNEVKEFLNSIEELKRSAFLYSETDMKKHVVAHPWLGNLNHVQWLWFSAYHIRIHTRQLERIVERFI